MQPIVYMTYERLYGTRSTREELLDELRPFALLPLLKLLAALNDHLRTEDNRPDLSLQTTLLNLFFSADEMRRMDDLNSGEPVVVVHRQQLLFLMKEVLFVSGTTGVILTTDFRPLGTALLRANDLLAHVFPKPSTLIERTLVAAAHFFSIQEAARFHSFEYKVLRSFRILKKILPLFANSQPFFDIPELFETQTRLGLTDFQVLQFMTMTCFIKDVAKTRPTAPIELPETWFRTTDFSAAVLDNYFNYVSASLDQLQQQVIAQREPSDFTAFRETPMLRTEGQLILLDFEFLGEKAESGPFWAARREIAESESNVYFSFWGKLFEGYIADILKLGSDSKLNFVIPNPCFEDGEQLTDCAVVCDDSLVMIEAKTSTISARAKYGADLGYLERTLRRNFVEDGKSPKALRQLVTGIRRFFKHGDPVKEVQATRINRVFPVVVTRDEVGSTVGINVFLNEVFQQLLRTEGLKLSQSIAPLVCLSAEDLERFSPRGKQIAFATILEGYFRGCRRDNAQLKPFMLVRNTAFENLPKSTEDIFKDTTAELGNLVESHMKAEQESP